MVVKMERTSSNYEPIRELDEERRELDKERRRRGVVPEMSIENYMEPPPFWELGGSINEEEEVRYEPHRPPRLANSSNRIRVKNIQTGVLIGFDKMINAARFVGTTGGNMRWRLEDETARVYCVGGKEYVFEYDGVEWPLEGGNHYYEMDGSVMVVSGKGERMPFPSFISAAKYLGLLLGHVQEERKRELARKFVLGKETFTLEFEGKRRQKDRGRGIHCRWKGIYDGDWEKIPGIKVTYGNPQIRD